MKNRVEITVSYKDMPFHPEDLEVFIETVLKKISAEDWSMGLLITTDDEIRNYNRVWRQNDSPTDVLTFVQSDGFPVPQPPGLLREAGDIVISLERIMKQSVAARRPLEEEMRRVVIHGILHLNGMIHPGDDHDNCEMLILQEKLVEETKVLAVKA